MFELILSIASTVLLLAVIGVIEAFLKEFLKEFENRCNEEIQKIDKEIEELKKLNEKLRKWLLK